MKTLIVAATQLEIEPFIKAHSKIDIVITGVGSVFAAQHLMEILPHHHYDVVIQAGVGGVFRDSDQSIDLGEVIAISKDAFGDLGCIENNTLKSIQDLGLSYNLEWLHNHHTIFADLPYKKAAGITVNLLSENEDHISLLQKKWNPVVESMEGAVLHHICLKRQIPFIQLRAISNYVGDRNKANWQLAKSIENLNKALSDTVDRLNSK